MSHLLQRAAYKTADVCNIFSLCKYSKSFVNLQPVCKATTIASAKATAAGAEQSTTTRNDANYEHSKVIFIIVLQTFIHISSSYQNKSKLPQFCLDWSNIVF